MAFLILSIQFYFGLPRALFCFWIHFNTILGNLPSAILWTWPYHVRWFCSIPFIKVTENHCVFWFSVQLLSEIFLTLRRIQRDMIKMYIGLCVKYWLLLLSDCNVTGIFSIFFRKTCCNIILFFCTLNQNMHTIISQIITPLHVSTLSCHPQTACNHYLAQLH